MSIHKVLMSCRSLLCKVYFSCKGLPLTEIFAHLPITAGHSPNFYRLASSSALILNQIVKRIRTI